MIVLHHCLSARSFRPLWMLEELGLPYQLKILPFPPRVHAREFLSENPLGTVPLLIDDELRMTESAAICQYLADRYAQGAFAVDKSEHTYGAYLNWLHMSDATLTFPQTLILRYRHFEVPERRVPQVSLDYERWFLSRLKAVAAVVARDDYLCEGRFTAADVAVGYALMLAEHLGLSTQFPASIQNYWMRLNMRSAFKRALAIQIRCALEQGVSTTLSPDIRP